jgi:hypothetical protein
MLPKLARFGASAALVLISAISAQAMLGLPYRPRFGNPTANYWAVAVLAALTPLLAYFVARTIAAKWPRRIGLIGALALMLPCSLVSSCAMFEAPLPAHRDTSYQLLSEAHDGAVAYRLYRTNCGATCAYGLDLREEMDLRWGAKLVSPMWSLYRASEGTVEVEESAVLVVRGNEVLGKVAR